LVHDTKTGKNVPNDHKLYQTIIKYSKARKIFQMAIKYSIVFESKDLQNLPKWDFWFENKPSGNPGWQPWFGNPSLATLVWQPWFGNPGLATLVWQPWFGNPGLATLSLFSLKFLSDFPGKKKQV
jgi:hypothetical protein